MTTNDNGGCHPGTHTGRPRHAAPHAQTRRARRRPFTMLTVVSTVAVATIAAGLSPVADASSPATNQSTTTRLAVAPAAASAAPRVAAHATSSPGTVDAAKQRRVTKRASRTSFRTAASPYRFASKNFNRWYAKRYMAYKYKWHRKQFKCLGPLWGKESAWNERAHNSSGAHGIPQAMPGSKMAKFGRSWRTNPTVQIKWGLSYVRGAYGTPCRAWSFWRSHHWY